MKSPLGGSIPFRDTNRIYFPLINDDRLQMGRLDDTGFWRNLFNGFDKRNEVSGSVGFLGEAIGELEVVPVGRDNYGRVTGYLK